MLIKTVKFTCILAYLSFSMGSPLHANVAFPETLYEIGDCITPTDPTWSWFGKHAKVADIVYSKYFGAFTYLLFIPESLIQPHGQFRILSIEDKTAKLSQCP